MHPAALLCLRGQLRGTDPSGPADQQTFTIPDTAGDPGSGGITARIYALPNGGGFDTSADVGPLIAKATINPDIPFRPSADPSCTGANAGKFVGPSGVCVNSLSVPLKFNFGDQPVAANQNVIWTVSFNTSNAGYSPIGNDTTCRQDGNPGCGYDSLNVGTRTYPGAPYAGTFKTGTDPNGEESFFDYSNPPLTPMTGAGLLEDGSGTCPDCVPPLGAADLTPLAKIITG